MSIINKNSVMRGWFHLFNFFFFFTFVDVFHTQSISKYFNLSLINLFQKLFIFTGDLYFWRNPVWFYIFFILLYSFQISKYSTFEFLSGFQSVISERWVLLHRDVCLSYYCSLQLHSNINIFHMNIYWNFNQN